MPNYKAETWCKRFPACTICSLMKVFSSLTKLFQLEGAFPAALVLHKIAAAYWFSQLHGEVKNRSCLTLHKIAAALVLYIMGRAENDNVFLVCLNLQSFSWVVYFAIVFLLEYYESVFMTCSGTCKNSHL